MYGLAAKYAELQKQTGPGGANPFIDPAGYKAHVESAEKAFLGRVAARK